eukprot:gene3910-5003_t
MQPALGYGAGGIWLRAESEEPRDGAARRAGSREQARSHNGFSQGGRMNEPLADATTTIAELKTRVLAFAR